MDLAPPFAPADTPAQVFKPFPDLKYMKTYFKFLKYQDKLAYNLLFNKVIKVWRQMLEHIHGWQLDKDQI